MSRPPRPRRNGERVEHKRADQLTTEDRGRIVQHPGNRGWLQGVELLPSGKVWVCTTTGVADYPADAMFTVWGHTERDSVLRRWTRQREAQLREYQAIP